jgi:hypothetical protein
MRPTTKSQKQPFPRQPRQPLDFSRAITHTRAGPCASLVPSRRILPPPPPVGVLPRGWRQLATSACRVHNGCKAARPHRRLGRGRLREPCPPDPATRPATNSSG